MAKIKWYGEKQQAANKHRLEYISLQIGFYLSGQSLEEAGYAIWAPNEPNNSPHPENPGHRDPYGNNESCGTMQRDGLLNDAWCDITFAFICEKHLVIDAIEKEMPAVIKD